MFRWLSRYVKQINILGIGIELREIPEEEALTVLAEKPTAMAATEPSAQAQAAPIVRRENFIRVSGVSPSSRRMPRDLDLMADGDEVQLHIHQPGGSQRMVWVSRGVLQKALDQVQHSGAASGELKLPGRTTRSEAEVAFVWDDSEEIEVQAGWWIWVPRQDLKAALAEVGVRAPW